MLLCGLPAFLWAQETVIKGKVTDANSGDPIPFANLIFPGTSTGATTDFDGNYEIRTTHPGDTLVVSYIGYLSRRKAVVKGKTQTIHFQIREDAQNLQEVVVLSGENPAFAIMRNVVKNKSRNDKRRLVAYEYDTYTKVEIDVDNLTDKFRKRKVVQKITQVLDSIERIAGEDGKPILPILITESVSKVYYRDKPTLRYEHILNSKVNGLGVEDGSTITQLVGSSFQEYNFYQNWVNIVTKDFVSPLADGWRLYYDFDLVDSLYVDGQFCYRLDFTPRSPQDLAFTGSIWITKEGYALKQIDAAVGKQANLNFVEKIKIQQELEPAEDGAWLPVKNRVLIDVGEMTSNSAGMLAKFYTSNKNFVINKPHDVSFYQLPITMAEDVRMHEAEVFWDSIRHEPLSATEKNVYKMIDTLQAIPVVRTYTDLIKIFINGYYKVGKVDIGPYISIFSYNNIEGVRLQPGFRTNIAFSDKWVFGAQLGYGFGDQRVKYTVSAQNIMSRRRWTTLTLSARSDLGRVGIDAEAAADNYLLLASQRFGYFRRGYYTNEVRADFKRELFKGFTQRMAFRYFTFEPTYDFAYYDQPDDIATSTVSQDFQSAEVTVETRYARDEMFLQSDNDRISLGTTRWPIITLRYTRGFKGLANSDFDYDKLRLSLFKRIRFGPLGEAFVDVMGEYIFTPLPYPLLGLHLGNQTPLYSAITYNLMNYGEFISDRYVTLRYRHYFEGFLLNRVPLLRKLKWRLLGTANVIYGGLSEANRALLAPNTPTGEPTLPVGYFGNEPYVELGYGVENIFRFLRIDFVHRVTYLDRPDVHNFGVLFSFQFQL
nr:DUF5686 and carboxypeptidase-like regulatory domain-containing protein [Chryseolinea lacunae]